MVVPSISLERTTAGSGTVMQAMEERALFLLLLLRQPRLRMIYVTSSPISEAIVEYYLGLLPGVIPSHARKRLQLVSVGDASPASLSSKLLGRPRLLRQIRELIPDPSQSHLIPYNTTDLERDVALSLGIPMYGADPRLAPSEQDGLSPALRRARCAGPDRGRGPGSLDDLVSAVCGLRARRRPGRGHRQDQRGRVRVGQRTGGPGGLPAPGTTPRADAVTARLRAMQPEATQLSVDDFLAGFARHGGIVEERITG